MRVLFIAYHPVDPQIVIEIANKIIKEGGEVLFVVNEKEGIIKRIIDTYNFRNIVIGNNKKSILGKIISTVNIVFKLFGITKKYKPDLIFSPTSPYTSVSCKFHSIPLICWADTETATTNMKYSYKRINSLLLPQSFYKDLMFKNVIRFNGYKELTYLHPNNFIPNDNILDELGLKKTDKIVLMRFSALNAMHDIGLRSEVIPNDDKILRFIKKIEIDYKAKVFISVTERDLDHRFNKYKLQIDPSKYVHFLSFCSLYIGEGTTTASEAGVLGVPWINIQQTERGYLIDQEKNYGLGVRIDDIDLAFQKAEEYLKNDHIKVEWKIKRKKLLEDKIDVSAFFSWFIINYPESHKIMKGDPDYQNRFK